MLKFSKKEWREAFERGINYRGAAFPDKAVVSGVVHVKSKGTTWMVPITINYVPADDDFTPKAINSPLGLVFEMPAIGPIQYSLDYISDQIIDNADTVQFSMLSQTN